MTYWYDNETTMHFTKTDDRAEIELAYTGEDPDFGTETLICGGDSTCTLLELCKDQLRDIEEFLDQTDNGTRRPAEGWNEFRDLNNTTLFQFEKLLRHIINDIEGRMNMNKKAETKFNVGDTVASVDALTHQVNIETGNFMTIPENQIGKILRVNCRSREIGEAHVDSFLVEFTNIKDYQTKTPMHVWVSELLLKKCDPKKWYMRIEDASRMIAQRLIKDRNVVFSFCESDKDEAQGNPEEHTDDGGWFGVKRIDGFFDNDPDEFIVAVGHYGGGGVGFGYSYDCTEYEYDAAKAVCKAICDASDIDKDSWIYVEEEEEKEDK